MRKEYPVCLAYYFLGETGPPQHLLSKALCRLQNISAYADIVACLIQRSASRLDLLRGLPSATLDVTMILAEVAQFSAYECYGEPTGSGRETGAFPKRHG